MHNHDELADAFLEIFESQHLSHTPNVSLSDLTLDDAYTVQQLVVNRRVANGEKVVGYKVGCTSRAIRGQFGLNEPICGRLMQPHIFQGDTILDWNSFHCPAVEPEFVLSMSRDVRDLVGPEDSLLDFIDFVSPGIEIHHYDWWFGEPTVQELICSNGIHASVVVGDKKISPHQFDWDLEGVGIFTNGELTDSGIGAEVMRGPISSLRWLANHLLKRGEVLQAGQFVIPGSAVSLVPVAPGDVMTAKFTHLGTATAEFRDR